MSGFKVKTSTAVEGDEHENTLTEGALFQETFPANFWQPGKAVRFHGSAIVNDQNSTDTLTMRIRFGDDGTTVTNDDALGVSNAVDVADADVAMVDGVLICEDVGDGTYRLVGSGVISDADASDLLVNHFVAVSTAFDPADPTYLSYTADWSVAHADNEVAGRSWLVEELTA